MPKSADRALQNRPVTRRLLLAAALSAPFISRAQAYPDRPIRVIVPGAPGGAVDSAARAISDGMQRELGQRWLVDPRPGANGVIAAKAFLDAPADGHVLYLAVLSHVLLPFITKVPFDVLTDFQPVAMIGTSTFLLCVPAKSPADTVAGFVAYARTNPGNLDYLNPGNATAPHLVPEMLKIRYGLDISPVYYKAISAGIGDLVAGDLDLGLLTTGLALPYVQQRRLKVIAQVSQRRLNGLAGVPTFAELGLGEVAADMYLPLYGRSSMSAEKVARINRAVGAVLAAPEIRARLVATHIEPLPMQPAEVGATLQREHDRLGAIIRQLGITADGS
jgi:tripartite-type tricarboxylate transporter receptor subunit TctC